MPIVGSVVLFSLFVMFTILPKDLVNLCLSGYFVLLGTFAISGTVLPFVEPLFPKGLREHGFNVHLPKVPFVMKEDTDISFTLPDLVCFLMSSVFCIWYCAQKHWYANNALGLAFSVQGIEHLSLGSVQVGAIMMVGLFVYDIFWVFCTPVMVSVAKSFDAPIKLLFPRPSGVDGRQFSMLGLGDIVVPGLFVALMLRYDVHQDKSTGRSSSYFHSVFWGYVAGLVATILVMNIFEAAQPALLYIVPSVLGAVALHAASRGELLKVFAFEEEHPPEGGEGSAQSEKQADGAETEDKKAQ
uniref:Minor histocompatibility antigen H13 n=1 Tax=Tetraselmis sp. GSL018 TaxID=582737 RepID=A0A061QWF5_9CHLO